MHQAFNENYWGSSESDERSVCQGGEGEARIGC